MVDCGCLSLVGAGLDLWRYYDSGGTFSWGAALVAPRLREVAELIPVRAASGLGDLFSTIVAGGQREIGGGVRGVMVGLLGSLLVVSAALVLQYYTLLFLYVRISSPSKRIRLAKLIELALRRFGRAWPLLLSVLASMGDAPRRRCSSDGPDDLAARRSGHLRGFRVPAGRSALWGARSTDCIAFNFDCWRRGAIPTLWFLLIALVNLCAFELAAVAFERSMDPGSFPGIALKLAFVFGRSFVLVWLAGAWLLMFCETFIGARKPRPK